MPTTIKSTVRHQTASSFPPCQTWPPHSYASQSPPLSVHKKKMIFNGAVLSQNNMSKVLLHNSP